MSAHRDRWPSQMIFVFAAVGSAVGLGNFWRFPFLVGRYGGGAFLLPYFIILLAMGIPLLMMEFALGQRFQQGAIGAFHRIHRRFAGVGLGTILCGLVVSCYYAVIMAWSLIYLSHSYTMDWGSDTAAFFAQVLHMSEGPSVMGDFNLSVLTALLISWVLVYFCVWKGVDSVSRVVAVTMPLPIAVLVVLLIRGVMLPGSWEGMLYYITPNFGALLDIEVWNAAMSQIFFTLTLGFGVMIAYGSYEKRGSDISRNAFIISLTNAGVSIVAGFAVFTTLGFMASVKSEPIAELAKAGPSLAFIVFPEVLTLIPAAKLFSILFFIMLATLAIDSLFSLVEAVSATLLDRFPHLKKSVVSFYCCAVCFLGGIVFTTQGGIFYLDIVDHFITSYGLVTMSLLQALVVGWYYGADNLRDYINKVSYWPIGSWWSIAIRYLVPSCLILLLTHSLYRDIVHPYEGYSQSVLFAFGWAVVFAVFLLSAAFSYLSSTEKLAPLQRGDDKKS